MTTSIVIAIYILVGGHYFSEGRETSKHFFLDRMCS